MCSHTEWVWIWIPTRCEFAATVLHKMHWGSNVFQRLQHMYACWLRKSSSELLGRLCHCSKSLRKYVTSLTHNCAMIEKTPVSSTWCMTRRDENDARGPCPQFIWVFRVCMCPLSRKARLSLVCVWLFEDHVPASSDCYASLESIKVNQECPTR